MVAGLLVGVIWKLADVVLALVIGGHDVEQFDGDVIFSWLTAGRLVLAPIGTCVTCWTEPGLSRTSQATLTVTCSKSAGCRSVVPAAVRLQ